VLENGVMSKEGTSAELANDPDVRRSYLGIV
jgi:ABC-type branched-subunit amino acid transport system ATPase component